MNANPIPPAQALPRIKAALDAGRPCRLVVTGGSMFPFLRDKRDAVIITPISGRIKRDDILFYLHSPQLCVLHRVRQVNPGGSLLLCGDAQTALELVYPEQVLGRVSHIQRGDRVISAKNPILLLLTVLWRWCYPIRPRLLALLRRLSKENSSSR